MKWATEGMKHGRKSRKKEGKKRIKRKNERDFNFFFIINETQNTKEKQ